MAGRLAWALTGALISSGIFAPAAAQEFSIDSRDDILQSAQTLAEDLTDLYDGSIPGLLDDDYWFWESGAFLSTLIDYWHVTGDDQYNDLVQAGLLHQMGSDANFMPANQTASLTNDDQCFWGLAALTAAETGFQSPPDGEPDWLELAQNVHENLWSRFQAETESDDGENETCGGGLRWVISFVNSGYNYKSSIPNACFFDLSARLASFTGNSTYSDSAVETWDWLEAIGILDTEVWHVYDGASVETNCSDVNLIQFSYTAGLMAHGSAFLYNSSDGSGPWQERVEGLTEATLDTFFPNGIAEEVSCELNGECNVDMVAMKGLAIRYLAGVAQLAPFTASSISPLLQTSAEAAIAQCTGGDSERQCGLYWSEGDFEEPETSGVGEQMNVLNAVTSLLLAESDAPETSENEGTDGGDDEGGDEPSGTSTESQPSESADVEDAAGHLAMGTTSFLMIVGGLVASTLL